MRISDWSSDVCSSDLLDEIEAYNRIDCISSAELRDWLVSIRPTAPWPELAPDASDKEVEEDADTQALRATLKESGLPMDRQDMLYNLGLFHKRAAKPAKCAIFDSFGKDEAHLKDDSAALEGRAGVEAEPKTP